ESFITLKNGVAGPRRGNVGPPVNPAVTTRVVEFNDLDALERVLATREISCILAEPAMTNVGIIHPDAGYHDALRVLSRKYDTLLIIYETPTICQRPGRYTREPYRYPALLLLGMP